MTISTPALECSLYFVIDWYNPLFSAGGPWPVVGCLVGLKDKNEVFVAEAPLSPFFPPLFFFCRMSLRWGLRRCLMSLQRPRHLLLRQHQLWAKAQKAATAARRAPPTQTAQTQKKSERLGWQSSRSRLLEWPSCVYVCLCSRKGLAEMCFFFLS